MPNSCLIVVCAVTLFWSSAWAQPDTPMPAPPQAQQRLMQSVVAVQTQTDDDASSTRSLGNQRQGSGVVIGTDLVLTVGYLLIEAQSVDLIDHRGRKIPGQVRAVDNINGLGLIRSLVPLRLEPVPLGDSDKLQAPTRLWTLGHSESAPTALELVSRKPFAGTWEYLLESPLMTLPAVNNWSGSGLFDEQGQLIGIGSLLVQDVFGDKLPLPGNLFVPVNVLKTPLPDLLRTGKRAGPAPSWLGIHSQARSDGGLVILRVAPNSPAEQAGIEVGDTLLALQGQAIADLADFYRRLWRLGPAGSSVELTVLRDNQTRAVKLVTGDRALSLKRPRGV
ncbi:hypothetical protein B9Z47_05605 [Limnohabitans sp. 2KL-1]|jgi:serine protease Do|uniref:S1C family serine protease n=1 Tax=Limnohabitans sp. 2KL-1 TaxID=1100699 RepID=UPI000D341DD5|nr:S1C family serine protease [Limnohabitans sp. 2KL-1]PUE48991.1 hypothetical protein B9Z47_05605 [Limnohabitans sp. 2KL-1]